jgi:hypothetical protein
LIVPVVYRSGELRVHDSQTKQEIPVLINPVLNSETVGNQSSARSRWLGASSLVPQRLRQGLHDLLGARKNQLGPRLVRTERRPPPPNLETSRRLFLGCFATVVGQPPKVGHGFRFDAMREEPLCVAADNVCPDPSKFPYRDRYVEHQVDVRNASRGELFNHDPRSSVDHGLPPTDCAMTSHQPLSQLVPPSPEGIAIYLGIRWHGESYKRPGVPQISDRTSAVAPTVGRKRSDRPPRLSRLSFARAASERLPRSYAYVVAQHPDLRHWARR